MKTIRFLAAAFLPALTIALLATPALAGEGRTVRDFPSLERRSVEIWSEGTRLAGDLYYPKERAEGELLPAIVLCHGWGGVKAHLNREIAPRFADAGYFVLTFDYRGWGSSDPRLVVTGEMPKPDRDGNVTVQATAIKQLVAPFDQQQDIDAAITWIEGEPGVDRDRIGIWGSSFGGGHVIYRAAIDDRVKCVVAQVAAMDARESVERMMAEQGKTLADLHERKIKRVRGELDQPVPQGVDRVPGLIGTPDIEKFADWVPADHTDGIKAPVLMIDADGEHYFDIDKHAGRVYRQLKGRVPVEHVLLKGIGHYSVYSGEDLNKVMEIEIPWFDKYLKGGK